MTDRPVFAQLGRHPDRASLESQSERSRVQGWEAFTGFFWGAPHFFAMPHHFFLWNKVSRHRNYISAARCLRVLKQNTKLASHFENQLHNQKQRINQNEKTS
jgi:hypothetical protein